MQTEVLFREEMVGPERLQEGVDPMMQVLTPYMTKVTLAELDSDGQVVHVRGDEHESRDLTPARGSCSSVTPIALMPQASRITEPKVWRGAIVTVERRPGRSGGGSSSGGCSPSWASRSAGFWRSCWWVRSRGWRLVRSPEPWRER